MSGRTSIDGRDALVVPLVAVRRAHERVDVFVAQVDAEALEDGGGALASRAAGEADDLVEVESRQLLGDVEPAAGGDALDDDVGEGRVTRPQAAGVVVSACDIHARHDTRERYPSLKGASACPNPRDPASPPVSLPLPAMLLKS